MGLVRKRKRAGNTVCCIGLFGKGWAEPNKT